MAVEAIPMGAKPVMSRRPEALVQHGAIPTGMTGRTVVCRTARMTGEAVPVTPARTMGIGMIRHTGYTFMALGTSLRFRSRMATVAMLGTPARRMGIGMPV